MHVECASPTLGCVGYYTAEQAKDKKACAICAITHPDAIRQTDPEVFDPKGGNQNFVEALNAIIEEQQIVPKGYHPCVSRLPQFQDRSTTEWVQFVVNAREAEIAGLENDKSYKCEAVRAQNTLCAECTSAVRKHQQSLLDRYFTKDGVLKETHLPNERP